MIKYIYSVASGTKDENEASDTKFYLNITDLYDALESLLTSEDKHLKTQGTKKPLRSTNALANCLEEDTVYVELMEKTRVLSWYNINKVDLEVLIG